MVCPRIVIAGTHSGVGKTSITLALVSALRRLGRKVQTFKVGPDFLDPSYLTAASGRPCYNLDGWMMGEQHARRLFARVSASADISVIEGVMGFFDGADPDTSEGSTAEIARWLNAPVILVVDAHAMARSIAAIVKGYTDFETGLNMAGIIANRCGSERHAELLSAALASASLPPLIGGILNHALPVLNSRHLGLVTADAKTLPDPVLSGLADGFERHVSLNKLITLAQGAPALPINTAEEEPLPDRYALGIARDAAFHFYYQDLFDELERQGCVLQFFSPIRDSALPEGIDGLYIGGGYPEENAEALSGNMDMISTIRRFAASGRPVYAECGGLMYLGRALEDRKGVKHPMTGVLPAETRMLDRIKTLGYVEATLDADSLWGRRGAIVRGHEFHYSELTADPTVNPEWQAIYSLKKRHDRPTFREGFQRGHVLASYTHMHYASRPDTVKHFLAMLEANP